MCDYRFESRKTVNNLPVPIDQTRRVFSPKAYNQMVKAIRDGRAMPGRDLYDGRPLSWRSLNQGHYMSP